jgi:succinyl-CoA synthetase beta subunit
MRLHEYEAANLLETMGIPVPRRGVAGSTDDALAIAGDIGYPVVLKAQVLVGGRGLAGGIRTASSPEELETLASDLLDQEIKGYRVDKILVAQQAEISKELYLGVTVDGYSGTPVVVASTEGGVHIEEVARTAPERIASIHVNPSLGLYQYQARKLLRTVGLHQSLVAPCADIVVRLYRVFTQMEAVIAEINPLVVLPNGGLMAVDAVLEVDPSALSRIQHPLPDPMGRIENPLERKGKKIGVTYVDLEGDIGIISSGAGLGMATMDIIGQRLRPANFLETGGGITEELLYKCMDLLMMKRRLKAVIINVYGGINPIHEGARGIVRYIQEHNVTIPIVAKALGNRQEETWEILRSGGVHVVTEAATEAAVGRLLELLGEKT